jgi:hypothetical protein
MGGLAPPASDDRLREQQPSLEPSRQSQATRLLARSKADEGRALNVCIFSGIYRAVLSLDRAAGQHVDGLGYR